MVSIMARKLVLSARAESVRSKTDIAFADTGWAKVFTEFHTNVEAIKAKSCLIDDTSESVPTNLVEDIYRSQIVFLESALDYFMHRLCIFAMRQMYEGDLDQSDAYRNLMIPVAQVVEALKHPEDQAWVGTAIIGYHSTKTYMSSKDIKGQLRMIFNTKGVFDKVACKMYAREDLDRKPEEELSSRLDEYFSRRNKIAHQADCNHETGEQYSIDRSYVETAIRDVDCFVQALQEIIKDSFSE